jgi:metallo-beta-lactamase family protein
MPFYVDSPLAIDVTEVFRLHPECYDQDITAFMRSDRHPGPFGFGRLEYVRSVEESKALNDRPGPMIIMAASGMAEAGRIRHHLANTLGDPRNTILFVGYQAENTLGRKLVEGEPTVRLFDESVKVRARVENIDGLSAHGDRHNLLEFVANARSPRLKGVFVIHGDMGPADALADAIRGIGIPNVLVPEPGQAVEL